MMQRIAGMLGLLACVAMPAVAKAQDGAGQEKTITGQVVDLSCYAHGQSGPSHKMCAEACAKAGVQLGILGSDGTLYIPISDKPADPTNSRLVSHAEGRVRVTGVHRLMNGLHTIEIKSITAAT